MKVYCCPLALERVNDLQDVERKPISILTVRHGKQRLSLEETK